MLLSRGFGGLGATPLVAQTGVLDRFDNAQTAQPDQAYTRVDLYGLMRAYLDQQALRRDAMIAKLTADHAAGNLKTCKQSYTESGGQLHAAWACRFALNEPDAARHLRVQGDAYLQPIGMFEALDLAFSPMDLKTGNQTFPDEPTIEVDVPLVGGQKLVPDLMIYIKSQLKIAETLYDVDLSERANLLDILADASESTGFVGLLTRKMKVYIPQANAWTYVKNPSLRQMMTAYAAANGQSWLSPGLGGAYAFPPVQPTDDEMEREGGALAYYRRGGYLILRNCALGAEPVEMKQLAFLQGFCWSDAGPACPVNVPVPILRRVAQQPFLIFVTILSRDVYRIRIQVKEKSTLAEVRDFIGNVLSKIPGLICTFKDSITSYNQGLLAETCVDSTTKKVCKKGEKNCVCTSATMSQAAAVAAANATLQLWCGAFQPKPTPAVPAVPMPQPPSNGWLWWALGGAALLGGAVLASRK